MLIFRKRMSLRAEVRASAEQVWSLLADFGRLPFWNPVVRRVDGRRTTNGGRLVLRAWLGQRIVHFSVFKSEPNRELRWRGRILFPGLLDDESVFVIESIDEERTWFTLQQVFTGLLVPLFDGSVESNARKGIQEIERALRCVVNDAAV
jgi:hypothetical protein